MPAFIAKGTGKAVGEDTAREIFTQIMFHIGGHGLIEHGSLRASAPINPLAVGRCRLVRDTNAGRRHPCRLYRFPLVPFLSLTVTHVPCANACRIPGSSRCDCHLCTTAYGVPGSPCCSPCPALLCCNAAIRFSMGGWLMNRRATVLLVSPAIPNAARFPGSSVLS
jgi:hypothetical protein